MTRPLRIAQVAPVACALPPSGSSSVELMTSLLTEGLARRGHDVTLFATANSHTSARLSSRFARGYCEDAAMWPWEMYELLNLAAAVERAGEFDVIHFQSRAYPVSLAFTRISPSPLVQTVHHLPTDDECASWRVYPEAPFIAVSKAQAERLAGLNVVGTVLHGIDTGAFRFEEHPDDYLLFCGRFTDGKGPLQAIEIARAAGMRLVLAGAANDYYREAIAPLVDGRGVLYAGEVSGEERVRLYGGARALLYPVQHAEPFGLVLAEAMACGTPVAALDQGAVREVVDDGVTGGVFASEADLLAALPRVCALDRTRVRAHAVQRFDVMRMVDEHVAVYERVIHRRRRRERIA